MDSLIPKRKSTPVLANSVIYNFSHDSAPVDSLQKVLGNIKPRTNLASRSSSINKLRYTPTKLLMVGQEVQGKLPAKKKSEKTLLQQRQPTLQSNSNKTPQPTEYLPTSPNGAKEYASSPAKRIPSQESPSKKSKDIYTFTSAARKLSKQKSSSSSKIDMKAIKSLNLEEDYATSVLYKSISQLSQKNNQAKSQKKIETSVHPNITKHINIIPNLETIQIEFNAQLPNFSLSDKEKMSYVQKRINEVTRMRRKVLDGEIGNFSNQKALKSQPKSFSKSLEARRESTFTDLHLKHLDHHYYQGSSFQPEKRIELPKIPIMTEQASSRVLPRSHHQRAESIPLSVRNFSLFEEKERERYGNFEILSKEKFSFKKLRSFTNHRLTFENVASKRFETSQEKNSTPIPNPYTRSLERSVREFLAQKNKQKLFNFKHPNANKRGINDLHDLFQLPRDDTPTKPFLTHRPPSINNRQTPPPPSFKRFSECEPELKEEMIIKKTCTTAHDLSSEIIFEEDTSRSEMKGW